jgi:2-C-methyl-D-erythritol 4-phosphate cytidylyltransferase
VLDWSIDAARAATDGVVLVVAADRADHGEPAADVVVVGGASRSDSVRAGLAALPANCTHVAVHDGARPLAGPALFIAVLDALDDAGVAGALPGATVTDTIKRVAGDVVVETIDRAHLVAVQTPQAFAVDVLRSAHAAGADATDDAALVEAAGGRIVVVPSSPTNIKITHPADLAFADVLLARAGDGGSGH